jgi:hypothetical protein
MLRSDAATLRRCQVRRIACLKDLRMQSTVLPFWCL